MTSPRLLLHPRVQLNMCKIAIKMLIEATIGLAPPHGESLRPLAQLLLVLEHVAKDGMRRRTLAASKESFALFDAIERLNVDVDSQIRDIVRAARSDPNIKSANGRGRHCLRRCLEQVTPRSPFFLSFSLSFS